VTDTNNGIAKNEDQKPTETIIQGHELDRFKLLREEIRTALLLNTLNKSFLLPKCD
jgi:hypothetical protein